MSRFLGDRNTEHQGAYISLAADDDLAWLFVMRGAQAAFVPLTVNDALWLYATIDEWLDSKNIKQHPA